MHDFSCISQHLGSWQLSVCYWPLTDISSIPALCGARTRRKSRFSFTLWDVKTTSLEALPCPMLVCVGLNSIIAKPFPAQLLAGSVWSTSGALQGFRRTCHCPTSEKDSPVYLGACESIRSKHYLCIWLVKQCLPASAWGTFPLCFPWELSEHGSA